VVEEDATAKAWETETGEPSDFLVAALHGERHPLPRRREGSKAAVYVLPEDGKQPRETGPAKLWREAAGVTLA